METIAVWFSCGAASAVAAMETIKRYKDTHKILIFNTVVDEEDSDNIRFKDDIQNIIDHEIIDARNSDLGHSSAEQIWKDRKYMSGIKGAPCTLLLKKGARYKKELEYDIDWHVLGFTYDEQDRHKRFTTFERKNVLPVLIDAKITKKHCFTILKDKGIKLPRIYEVFDNANCIGCVKATGVDYWQRVRKHYPNIFEARATLSREIGCKLTRIKGKRIYLDELPLHARGRRTSRYDCGIFCDLPQIKF